MAFITELTLGDITFSNMEIPERMPFGGAHMLGKQQQVGGQRQLNALGPDDADIPWSGTFRGLTAVYRARYVDGLRKAGAVVRLSYADFLYNVIISDFHCDFQRNGFVLPYTISVAIAEDLTQPINFAVPDTIDTAVQDALIKAQAYAVLISNPSFSSALAAAAATIDAISPLSDATAAEIAGAAALLLQAQSIATQGISDATSSLFG